MPRRTNQRRPARDAGPLAKLEQELHEGWLVQRGLATFADIRAAKKQGRPALDVARERRDAEAREKRDARVSADAARKLLSSYLAA